MNELDDILVRVRLAAAAAGVPPCIPDVRRRVVECVRAANPYGCNQYGEGWKMPHNGKSVRYPRGADGKPRRDGEGEPPEGKPGKPEGGKPKTREELIKETEALAGSRGSAYWHDNVRDEHIAEFNAAIAEMRKKYPGISVEGIGSYVSGDNSTGAAYFPGTHSIRLNADHARGGVHDFPSWKAREVVVLEGSKTYDFKRHNVGSTAQGITIRAVTIHEWGHALHFQAMRLWRPAKSDVITAFKRARRNGDIAKISKYSMTNFKEFFAECFAARELGETLPDYLNKMLDDVTKMANTPRK